MVYIAQKDVSGFRKNQKVTHTFAARGDISINIAFPSSSTLGFNVATAAAEDRLVAVVENDAADLANEGRGPFLLGSRACLEPLCKGRIFRLCCGQVS
jgi:hypothetical protein